jgi:hypothetical protein
METFINTPLISLIDLAIDYLVLQWKFSRQLWRNIERS